MPDERPALQAKGTTPEARELILWMKAKLKKMNVEEQSVILDLARAFRDCVKRDKGVLPEPPYELRSGPRT